jgi:hypothetical protein
VIAAPAFYAARLGPPFVSHETALDAHLPRPLRLAAARSGLVRGLALGWLARSGVGVALIRRERGSLPALLVCALPPARRSVFVLELIRRPLPRSWWRRALYRLWWRAVENPALGRGMVAAQVMTRWERDEYARHYRLDPRRIHHVPWALREGDGPDPEPISDSARTVFSSGRTACDWETLFQAAAGRAWDLSVICSQKDADRVRALATEVTAKVRVETPWPVHDAILRQAAVCAIAIEDRGLSAGHVRLMSAVEAGIAVVCSDVPSVEGYVEAGDTAVLVPPTDPVAFGRAVDLLLGDPPRRRQLRDAARSRADAWTYREYFDRIRGLIAQAPAASAGHEAGA